MLQAVIEGPPGTPYQGGQFRVKLALSKDYPASPPKGTFIVNLIVNSMIINHSRTAFSVE